LPAGDGVRHAAPGATILTDTAAMRYRKAADGRTAPVYNPAQE
jgi:hypothetical protein